MNGRSTEMVVADAPGEMVGGGDLGTLMRLLSGSALDACKAIARSEFAPKSYSNKPESIAIAAAMGARLGLDVFSSIQNIAVINGRPTLWGDAMLAVCQSHPHWRGMDVEWSASNGGGEDTVTVTVRRAEGQDVGRYVGRFSVKEARTAGVWEKTGPWTQYPRRMLELRARSFALRSAFADALMGFLAREEMDDADHAPSGGRVYEMKPAVALLTRPSSAAPATPIATHEAAAEPESPAPPPAARPIVEAVKRAMGRGVDRAFVLSALGDLLGSPVRTSEDVPAEREVEAVECVDALVKE